MPTEDHVLGVSADFHSTLPLDCAAPLTEQTGLLNDACARIERGPGPSVLALRPTGLPSAAGWPGPTGIQEVNRWERALRRLERLRGAVSVCAVEGECGGPALDLLLACDYRIVSPDLRLVLPVNDGHFWPGTAVHRLARELGSGHARRLVLWGHELTADQAREVGLVDQVSVDLDEAVQAAAVLLGPTAGPELAVRRQLLKEAGATGLDEALGTHLAACDRELRRLRAGEPAPVDGRAP